MKTYEVKYGICLTAGKTVLMVSTVEANSPEFAKKMVFTMVLRARPSKEKTKFMHVREITNGCPSVFNTCSLYYKIV